MKEKRKKVQKQIHCAPLNADDIKQRSLKLSEKKLDFFHSLGKFTFTALVLGILVSIIQDTDKINYSNLFILLTGLLATYLFYKIGNNNLKN